MFNSSRVMKHMNNFTFQDKPISCRRHSRTELNGTYKPEVKRTIYYLSIIPYYKSENFIETMPPQQSVKIFLATLQSKVSEELLKDQKKYDGMKWKDTRKRRALHFLYKKEVDQHCKRIMGYKFRQRPFTHFVQEQMDVEKGSLFYFSS